MTLAFVSVVVFGKCSTMPSPEDTFNILHLCSIKGRGGTGYMAGRICRMLHEKGHTIFVGGCPGSKIEQRARDAGILTVDGLHLRRGFHPVGLWNDVKRIRNCIRENSIDIVHCWHSIEYWTGALSVIGTGVKLARTRGLVTPLSGHIFNKIIHHRTDAVFATCARIESVYRDAGFAMANVFRLDDGVDISRFHPDASPASLRQEFNIPDNAMLVASIGRLEKVKDQATLLSAMGMLPNNVHAVLAGDGSCRESLERQAGSLGISDRIHFLGVRDDIEQILVACDAYCLCSTGSEGSSRATLEAMACGLPCVTTMVGMLPDIVKPGLTGLLFPAGDVDALVECIENLLHDQRLRHRLSERALAMVKEKHSEEAMINSVLSVYRKVCR